MIGQHIDNRKKVIENADKCKADPWQIGYLTGVKKNDTSLSDYIVSLYTQYWWSKFIDIKKCSSIPKENSMILTTSLSIWIAGQYKSKDHVNAEDVF